MNLKHIISILLATILLCSSCKDKLFEFDLQNIEVDGEWGIPVFNGTISMNKLLQQLDSVQYIQVGSDGILKFIYEHDIPNIVSMSNIFTISDRQFDTSGVYHIDQLPTFSINQALKFNLNSNKFAIKHTKIKSGVISLYFHIPTTQFTYSAILTTNNITDADGNPVTIAFNNTQTQQNFNLNAYEIHPDVNGDLYINATITVNTSVAVSQISYETSLALSDISICSITGQFEPVYHTLKNSIGFNLPFDKLNFDNININNAKISFLGKNDICHVIGSLNELLLYGSHGGYTPLITTPTSFNFPVHPNEYISVLETSIASLRYHPGLDSLSFDLDFNVNPEGFAAGDIYIDENSKVNGKIKAEIPAHLSIDNAVYHDTIANSLHHAIDISSLPTLESITLRVAFINTFPFDLIPSIDFYDSRTGDKYHVDMNELQLHGSYNDVPYVQEPIYIEFKHNDAVKILNYDQIILNFRLNTQGNEVEIKDSQYVRAAIGAKVNYSNIIF